MMTNSRRHFLQLTLLLAFSNAHGQTPATASLSITGQVLKPTQGQTAVFDLAALKQLPQMEIRTHTRWTEGVIVFQGPLLREVLKSAGAQGKRLQAIALNYYKVDIPWQDIEQYPVILALSANGKPLSRREKGPIWIMYPMDDYKALQTPDTHSKLIWQLKTIHVE